MADQVEQLGSPMQWADRQSTKRTSWRTAATLVAALHFLAPLHLSSPNAAESGADTKSHFAPPPSDCSFDASTSFATRGITDSENILLEDGREFNLGVRTASLDDPAARNALQVLVTGRALILATSHTATAERIDRYGRLLGSAVVKAGEQTVWIEGTLVTQGLARVTFSRAIRCGQYELLRLEDQARRQKAGHWATGVFNVLDANDAAAVATHTGHFAIVEGRLHRRSKSRKGIYYNFGRDWREDVTVFVPARLMRRRNKSSSRNGRKSDGLDGNGKTTAAMTLGLEVKVHTRLRARGWIENRGGPLIEVRHLEQIEWIE